MNLKELGDRIGLDEDEFRELIELFVETGTADYEQLQSAIDAGDAPLAARHAHTLNGASGNLGLMDVHEVAKRIELAAGQNQLDTVSDDLTALKGLLDKIADNVRV